MTSRGIPWISPYRSCIMPLLPCNHYFYFRWWHEPLGMTQRCRPWSPLWVDCKSARIAPPCIEALPAAAAPQIRLVLIQTKVWRSCMRLGEGLWYPWVFPFLLNWKLSSVSHYLAIQTIADHNLYQYFRYDSVYIREGVCLCVCGFSAPCSPWLWAISVCKKYI